MDDGNGWTEYQRLVIHRLARIEGRLDHIETRDRKIRWRTSLWCTPSRFLLVAN